MVQSLNTKTSAPFQAIAYVGIGSVYGKLLIGDKAFEFFNDANVADTIQIPWETIHHVEGIVTRQNKISRQFIIVLNRQGNSKRQNHVRFSSKDAGKVLKLIREHIGNDKVVKAPTLMSKVKKLLTKRKS
ncbi:DUF956 family protein [Pseudolactococcus reticulitermitis]|uniref:Regulator of the mannose operon, ManO n=1 Tax=Pseudolactococcus reticulitermitis TaxID=2025039 RepID=A0A224XC82_9LACT|nr:DUF956 family protein [Lactococcus reticulitermitis]GAX47243.1 hypothetical protein RsY01_842 [Lactococcus reticulitermitis]